MNNLTDSIFRVLFWVAILAIWSCKKDEKQPDVPAIATKIHSFTDSSAVLGGTVTSLGGKNLASVGVCYGTATGPTVSGLKEEIPATNSLFAITFQFLAANTNYYARAFARFSDSSIVYGDEVVFTTKLLVGSRYRDGIVYYIEPSSLTGLIMASTDAPTTKPWGCEGTNVSTSIDLLRGKDNTLFIISACPAPTTAARYCYDFPSDGTHNWHLPSQLELNALLNSSLSEKLNGTYWTSSQASATNAYAIKFEGSGFSVSQKKSLEFKVRPVKSF